MAFFEKRISQLFKQTLTRISPRLNTEVIYFIKFKKRINLKHPKTLDENEGTKRISDDFVITKLFIGVVDDSTVYLLKEDGKIKGYAVVAEP